MTRPLLTNKWLFTMEKEKKSSLVRKFFSINFLQVHTERALRVSFSKTCPVLFQNIPLAFSKQLFSCMLTAFNAFRDVNVVTWSPDGKSLASASDDNTVRVWDASTGQCQWTLTGHSDW